jgi:pyridoxamine 5'-phosphate oxidase
MSSTPLTARPSLTAPWKRLFAQHLEKLGGASAEFYLATVNAAGQPRVRTCINRGFWATPPENSHNKLPKNPHAYESDCPTFTTDARMSKTYEIFATGKGKGSLEQSRCGSGGGGPVEALYWVKEAMTQWRIRGKCWIIAADDVEGGRDAAQNPGTVRMKAALGRYMRTRGGQEGHEADWSWRREIENHYENLSPTMRGTFKNPPPGQPVLAGKSEGERLGQKGGRLQDEDLARRNFRVAVITPEEVEQVDLNDPSATKRWIYTLAGDGDESRPVGEWHMVEMWP